MTAPPESAVQAVPFDAYVDQPESQDRPRADQTSSDAEGAETARSPATGNAVRVARHRARQAARGLKQLNVQVPVDAHAVVKSLARRLRDGEDLTLVLFDLVADVTAPDLARAAAASIPTPGRDVERAERRQAPRPPLERTELKRAPPGVPTRPGEEEELIRRARQVLRRGGWRATVIRRMVE